jgi:tetratricopeptide (TPR) repeat protein
LVAALLLLTLGLQGQPEVTATVDRKQVALGDILTFTIRVNATGNEAVEIVDPILDGLIVIGTREASQVTLTSGAPLRATTRELRLRAMRVGKVTIGAVHVRQGTLRVRQRWAVAQTDPITIQVAASASAVAETLDPRVKLLLERSPPPANPADVALTVLPPTGPITVGDQVDLVVAAWFPRDLRSRLRQPPVISPPDIQGGWTYQQSTPTGIAASRLVRGQWLDLFVTHQVVFPLAAGRLGVGRAVVAYSLPLNYAFLSHEQRHEIASDSLFIEVLPQPAAGRPAQFAGAAAADLKVGIDATPREVSTGEAIQVAASLTGRGNVSLWPEPVVRWPDGVRVYPGDVEVSLAPVQGLIAGTKTFHYLLVADSVGTYAVSPPAYAYFDLASRRYLETRGPDLRLVVHAGAVGGTRAAPPPLLPLADPSPLLALVRGIPVAGWIAILVVPLIAIAIARRPRSAPVPRRRPLQRGRTRPKPGSLEELELQFRQLLARLVPDADVREGDGLADALRAAGTEAAVATHAARLRDRLWHAVYGSSGGGASDPAELAAEVRGVLEALLGAAADVSRRGLLLLFLALLAWVSPAQAQVSAERLYDIGAYRAAADSFSARALEQPDVAEHWFNMGDALYRLGLDGRARAAWLKAARLAPRDPSVRRALTLVPAPDAASQQLTAVAPVTPAEALVIAAAAWFLACTLILFRLPRRHVVPALAVVLGFVGYAAYVANDYDRAVAVVADQETALRSAPYGTAAPLQYLPSGAAVVIVERSGVWLRVARDRGQGWVLKAEVEAL